jgi:hypothetical protein
MELYENDGEYDDDDAADDDDDNDNNNNNNDKAPFHLNCFLRTI